MKMSEVQKRSATYKRVIRHLAIVRSSSKNDIMKVLAIPDTTARQSIQQAIIDGVIHVSEWVRTPHGPTKIYTFGAGVSVEKPAPSYNAEYQRERRELKAAASRSAKADQSWNDRRRAMRAALKSDTNEAAIDAQEAAERLERHKTAREQVNKRLRELLAAQPRNVFASLIAQVA
jgi:predicted ArsR family transcriptional regulator